MAKYYIYGNEQAKQLVGELFANTELTAPRVDGNVIDIVEQLDKRDLLDDMRLESNIGQGIVEIYNQVLYEIEAICIIRWDFDKFHLIFLTQ